MMIWEMSRERARDWKTFLVINNFSSIFSNLFFSPLSLITEMLQTNVCINSRTFFWLAVMLMEPPPPSPGKEEVVNGREFYGFSICSLIPQLMVGASSLKLINESWANFVMVSMKTLWQISRNDWGPQRGFLQQQLKQLSHVSRQQSTHIIRFHLCVVMALCSRFVSSSTATGSGENSSNIVLRFFSSFSFQFSSKGELN